MRTAQRRADDDRILRRRMALPRYQWAMGNARWMGVYRNTGTICSCLCCRPRRYQRPSPQERRQVAYMEKLP